MMEYVFVVYYIKNDGLKALEFINNGRTYNGNRPYPKMTDNFFHS